MSVSFQVFFETSLSSPRKKKIDELLHHFLANFEKLVQTIATSGNCLQFPEIPTKISENFTEKSAIPVKFQQHFEKSRKINKMCEHLKF
jgi:hypothetical protein